MGNIKPIKVLELINSLSSGYLTIPELWEISTGGNLYMDFHLPLNIVMDFKLKISSKSVELQVTAVHRYHNSCLKPNIQLWLEKGWHIKRHSHSVEMTKRVLIHQRHIPTNPIRFIGRIIRSLQFP